MRYAGYLLGLCLLIHSWVAFPSQAQIVLNAEHFQKVVGKVYTTTAYTVDLKLSANEQQLNDLIAQSGPNQTWDFTTLSYVSDTTTSSVSYLPYSNNLPGAAVFPEADHAMVVHIDSMTSAYFYGSLLQDDGQYYYGMAAGDSTLRLDPPLRFLAFPLTYQTSWELSTTDLQGYIQFWAAFTGDSVEVPSQFEGASVQILFEVDGYGQLITPAGSVESLRLKRTIRLNHPDFGSVDGAVDYIWISEDWLDANPSAIIAAGITTTVQFSGFPPAPTQKPVGAYYSVSTLGEPTAREALPQLPVVTIQGPAPNPFTDQATLTLSMPSSQPVSVRVYNLLGQEMARPFEGWLPPGTYRLPIVAKAEWPAGLYLCRITAGGKQWTRSFVLMR